MTRRRRAVSPSVIGTGEPLDVSTYVSAVWHRPGARLQILTIFGFGIGVVIKSGVLVALVLLAVGLGTGFAYGYRRFKRTGRVY